jgi:orotate phosphoribosyltransferase
VTVDSPRQWLIDAVREHVHWGGFQLASGEESDWHADCKQISFEPTMGLSVARLFHHTLREADVHYNAVGGVGYGGTPLAVLLAVHRSCHSFAVRTERKDYGFHPGGLIAGPLRVGDRVVLVEDVMTSGGSVVSALEAISAFGAQVVAVACILSRRGLSPRLPRPHSDIPVFALLSAADLGIEGA